MVVVLAWVGEARPGLAERVVGPVLAKLRAVAGLTEQTRGVVVVCGGAAGLYELLVPKLRSLIEHGVVRQTCQTLGCLLLDGGTESGVMEFVGSAARAVRNSVVAWGDMDAEEDDTDAAAAASPLPFLIGVAPAASVQWPGREDTPRGNWPSALEPNHDLFVLAETRPGDRAFPSIGQESPARPVRGSAGRLRTRSGRSWAPSEVRGEGSVSLGGAKPGP